MRLLILALTLGVILVPEDAAARRPWFRRFQSARESSSRTDSAARMKSIPGLDLDGDGIADDPGAIIDHPATWDLNGDGIADVPPSAFSAPRVPATLGR